MARTDESLAADRLAGAGLGIAVLLAVGHTVGGWMGWLMAYSLSRHYWAFAFFFYWFLVFAWFVCVVSLLSRRRHYWILLTAPIVLLPALFGGLIIVGCMQGDCL